MRFRGLQSAQPASHRACAANSEGQILSIHFPAPKVLALVLSKKGSWCYTPGFRLQRTNWERSGISGRILRIGTFSKLSQRVLASRNLHPSPPHPRHHLPPVQAPVRPHDHHIPIQSRATRLQAGVLIRVISSHVRATELGWTAFRHKLLQPDQPFFNPEQNLKCGCGTLRPSGLAFLLLRSAWGKKKKKAGQRSWL